MYLVTFNSHLMNSSACSLSQFSSTAYVSSWAQFAAKRRYPSPQSYVSINQLLGFECLLLMRKQPDCPLRRKT